MKADVINRFIDAESGAVHLPGAEVEMDRDRIARLASKGCVAAKESVSRTPAKRKTRRRKTNED